ncbi:MAG: winged helix DNA-binding protein [Sphingopyxis sp.]|nr:winged helix DNA-binding protein [Sphingopyxis sp.]
MQQFSNQEVAELKSRIDEIHELLAGRGGELPTPPTYRSGSESGESSPQAVLLNQLSLSIQIRRIRRNHFGSAELAGPIWDMMLDLMLAESHGRALSASDLATGAGVPLSSGLRMISALERLGLAQRSIDERDRRRTIVNLTASGAERMASYFEKIGVASQNNQTLAA